MRPSGFGLEARRGSCGRSSATGSSRHRLRHRDEEALRERHAELAEPLHDVAALDALRDRLNLERARHARDRLDDALVGAVAQHVAHELAVDLHVVHGQVLEVRQRRQAGAEVVEREAAAARLQRAHERDHAIQVRDRRRLRDLEADRARDDRGSRQLVEHEIEEPRIVQRRARQVDREHVRRRAGRAAVRERLERVTDRPSDRAPASGCSARPPE